MNKRRPVRKILWFASSLRQAGGGERLLLEGAQYFEKIGIETIIVTFKFHESALFSHHYHPRHIIELLKDRERFSTYSGLGALAYLLRAVLLLGKAIANIDPDIIVVQSEDNAALVWLAMIWKPRRYVALLFGQMFQYPTDLTKYALPFRKHLPEIRNSTVGFQQTIRLTAPRISLGKRLIVELRAWARYLSVRRAERILVLTRQVRWEVAKLYGCDSLLLKGAFPASIFEYRPGLNVRQELGLPAGKLVLTVSRLAAKKNVALCLRAFKQVAEKSADVTLIIGGTGPEAASLKALARELDLASRVIFVGYIEEQRLWDYYSSCDVFMLLDTADFNLVLYEVLALGKRVVLSTDQEVDDILAGSRLIFAAPPQVQPVAQALECALVSQLQDMTPEEKTKLAQYTWDNYFGNILKEMEASD